MAESDVVPSPLVSIVINNYNYAQFIGDAIDSALQQDYSPRELIVVDDGSDDGSRDVIERFGQHIRRVYLTNGGQAAALNAGVAASAGDWISFLDADDTFLPNKLSRLMEARPGAGHLQSVLLYHLVEAVDSSGVPLGFELPRSSTRWPANLYEYACRYHYLPFLSAPTSGITLSRRLAQEIFPIPVAHARTSADDFVVRAALLLGEACSLAEVLGRYRVHGQNRWYGKTGQKSREFLEELDRYLNERLVASGREPVISFFDSMYSREYWMERRNFGRLWQLVHRIPAQSPGFASARFAGRTMIEMIRLALQPHRS